LKRQKTAPKYFNLSSGAVYFLNEKANSPYREFMAVKPDGNRRSINVYAKAKWESEEIIRQGTALGHVWGINLRVFSLSGPMLPLDQHFAFGNFLLDVKREKSIQISGNPLTTRSYLYIAELIYWIFVINIKMPLLPINVGGFHEISMIQLAEKINSILNGIGITVNDSIQDSNCYVPNMELFKKILEVQQSILIEQQIDQHFRWIKETGLSTQT
jgi:dTDP-glucose 4,6-dehydratase